MFNPQIYENSRPDGIGVLEVIGGEQAALQRFVPLQRTELRGEIVGPLATLCLTQTFGYSSGLCDRVLEAVYRFPLPGDAAVTGVTVHFGTVEIVAELKERSAAEADYAQAKQEGRQAALTTREAPDVFTLQVAGLHPDKQIVVETHYVQLARSEGLAWSIRTPLTTAPRYVRTDELTSRHAQGQPLALLRDPGHRFTLDLQVQGADQIASPTHALALVKQPDGVQVQLQVGEVLPDRDFVLAWQPDQAKTRPRLQVFGYHDRQEEAIYFLAHVAPPAAPSAKKAISREIILLVDHSGSMQGAKWAATDWAVERFLSDLHEKDRFALAVFHNQTKWFEPKLLSADAKTVERAISWIKQMRDSGGTELGVALEQGLKVARIQGEAARHLLILTDAAVSDAGRILRLADSEAIHTQRRRISVLCVDAAPNAFLALELAERGGGLARFLTSDPEQEDITTALDEVLADWSEPVLVGMQLSVNRPQVEVSSGQITKTDGDTRCALDLGDLPAGRTRWTVGRTPYAGADKLSFRLQGTDGNQLDLETLDFSKPQAPATLKALFGARRINGLEFLINAGYSGEQLRTQLARLGYDPDKVLDNQVKTPPAVYAENARSEAAAVLHTLLVQEALAYHLASSETSFVATRREAGALVTDKVIVANALPAGWSDDFLAGGVSFGGVRALSAMPASPQVARAISMSAAPGLPMPPMGLAAPDSGLMARSVRAVAKYARGSAPSEKSDQMANDIRCLFKGQPHFTHQEALLFDSSQDEQALPSAGAITGVEVRLVDKLDTDKLDTDSSTFVSDREVHILLFVGDLAAPRAKIRLGDLLRHGLRPLNLVRQVGQVVRIVLQDPKGTLRKQPPQLELFLYC